MNRRSFIRDISKKTIAVTGLLSLNVPFARSILNTRDSKNWVWLTPDISASDDDWKRRFERLKNANFDGIIPEIYDGKYAYFASDRLPVKQEYLERLIPIAKSFNLEIHAWMWSMPCMVEEVQKKHSDWYNVNRLGQSSLDNPAYVDYYKFLCPAKVEVHEFIMGTVKELSEYDIDGIHLDYIRYPDVILAKGLWSKYDIVQDKEYPQYDYCYCDTCREKFKKLAGIDPLKIKEPSMNGEWLQFRYDQVTDLVNNKLIPIGHNKGKAMSAAVFPNWRKVRQEWSKWKLDMVFPMLYNQFYLSNAEWIKQSCKEGIASLKNNTQLYSGLMIDEPGKLKNYILKSFEGDAKGISIFSMNNLKDEHYELLEELLKGL